MSDGTIFVSYAHDDSDVVNRDLNWLASRDINVWHDTRLRGGVVWREEIAEKIAAARAVLCFVSRASLRSEICRQELDFALDENKPLLCVFLEQQALSPGLRLSLGHRQGLHRYLLSESEFQQKLLEAARHLVTPHRVPDTRDQGEPLTRMLPDSLVLQFESREIVLPSSFDGFFSIGRSALCQLTIESPYASTQHGYIRCHRGEYHYRDESRNGTTLVTHEGESLVQNEEVALPRSGALQIGDILIRFQRGEPQGS